VVVVDFQANFSDELHITNLVSVEIVQKIDEDVEIQVHIVVGQGNKSNNKRVLLSYLIHQNKFAVRFSELVVDE